MTVSPRRRPRLFDRAAALLSSVLLVAGIASLGSIAVATPATAATLADAGLDAPIHAFDWPSSAPNDPYYREQLDLTVIAVAPAWVLSTGVGGPVVAVLDTGIDASHPEFSGRLVPGFNALTGQADGAADFGPTNDDEGHGTHVSGTIAAAANNGLGMAGIAPGISIMPIKILDATGSGDFSDMRDGMTWAIAHGARIITMSLGGTLNSAGVTNLQATFDTAYSAGVVVVAAAGNDGSSTTEYPCSFIHVICVGSTTQDGTAVSTFSTRSPAVALVAPGERIVSALPGNGYGYGSGTSMATPHVTGAVALMRTIAPGISPDEILADLTQTARPLVAGGRNNDSGYGLLQVGPALDLAAGGPGAPVGTPTPTPTPDPNATPTPTPDPNVTPTPTPDPAASPTPTPVATPAPPTVQSSVPRNGTRNVARSTRPKLTFSVPMSGISTRTITMRDLSTGRTVLLRVSYSATSRVATISPKSRLAANHSYRISVTGITSADGALPLRRTFAVTFRTGYH